MALLKYKMNLKKIRIFIIIISITSLIVLIFYLYTNSSNRNTNTQVYLNNNSNNNKKQEVQELVIVETKGSDISFNMLPIIPEKYNEHEYKNRVIQEKIKRLTGGMNGNAEDNHHLEEKDKKNDKLRIFIPNVHIFYYAPVKWYRSDSIFNYNTFSRVYDNNSNSNNMNNNNSNSVAMQIKNQQNDHLNIAFYPEKGLYTTNEHILKEHFRDIQKVGVGVIVLNWVPNFSEIHLKQVFLFAKKFNLHISIQIDNYPDRTIESIRNNIKYFIDNYGDNLSFNRIFILSKRQYLPVFYIKDAFMLGDSDWRRFLTKNGILSIRDTHYDAILIAHISIKDHKSFVRRANFDGFYTQLASNGATYCSTWKNWVYLKKFADLYKLIFIPTVGPGFYDKRKQPRHGSIRRYRSNGQYYGVAWRTAISNNVQFISISSFNNWPEGTQIEQSIPVSGYRDYHPGNPNKYLDLTRHWLDEFYKSKATKTTLSCSDWLNSTIC